MSEKENHFESLEIEFEHLFNLIFLEHKITYLNKSYENQEEQEQKSEDCERESN